MKKGKKETAEVKGTTNVKQTINYELERDRISLKFGIVLIFFGTAAAGSLGKMFEDSFSSTAAIVAVCIVLMLLDRGIRYLVSRSLNAKAAKRGDPIPFDKKNMF